MCDDNIVHSSAPTLENNGTQHIHMTISESIIKTQHYVICENVP